MKHLYLVLIFILHWLIFKFFGDRDRFVIVALLSLSITVIGILLYKNKNKEKVISDLGWGIMFGSFVYFTFIAIVCVCFYSVTVNSDF